MALGNFNNLIALRTKDLETARFAIETFGRTKIASTTTGLVSQSASDAPGRFSSGFTRRETSERDPPFGGLLARTPSQYRVLCFACRSNDRQGARSGFNG